MNATAKSGCFLLLAICAAQAAASTPKENLDRGRLAEDSSSDSSVPPKVTKSPVLEADGLRAHVARLEKVIDRLQSELADAKAALEAERKGTVKRQSDASSEDESTAPTTLDPTTATPTEEPTVEPTEAPSMEPTNAPTANPTSTPSEEPTATPSHLPTEKPTAEPTVNKEHDCDSCGDDCGPECYECTVWGEECPSECFHSLTALGKGNAKEPLQALGKNKRSKVNGCDSFFANTSRPDDFSKLLSAAVKDYDDGKCGGNTGEFCLDHVAASGYSKGKKPTKGKKSRRRLLSADDDSEEVEESANVDTLMNLIESEDQSNAEVGGFSCW